MALVLRSENSNDPAFVTFVNKTSRSVDIVWHEYEGNKVLYQKLRLKQFVDVNTYKNHPWTAVDSATGVSLLLNGRPVFYPVSLREIHERLRFVQVPLRSLACKRSEINITLPFFSLSELCLHVIMQCLNNVDDVKRLEVPKKLKDDLEALFVNRSSYVETLRHTNG